MRAVYALVSAALVRLACASSPEASVYIFNHNSPPSASKQTPSSVSPSTARLLLAQRLGLSGYHKLEKAEDSVLSLLNRFGIIEPSLFSGSKDNEAARKVLVMVDGVDDHDRFFEHGQTPAFTISSPAPPSSNRKLVTDFLVQDSHRRGATGKGCQGDLLHSTMINGGISSDNPYGTCLFEAPLKNTMSSIDPLQELKLLKELTVSSPPSTTFIFHISLLDIVAQGGLSNQYHQAIAELKQLLAELIGPSVAQASTVVFTAGASKHSKRVVNDYGSYIVPVSNLGIREQQEEEPLSFAHRPASSSPVSHDSTRSQTLVLKSSIRPKVTMPICHSTNSSCMSTTENCSGHGTCYKKNPDPSDDSAQDCWACGCTPSVRKNEEGGIKTTHWGGPACQKKDVSAPFFLLAGFTITMVAALSWGVGLMYSIGEEELPSVIGAGVAGPRAQK